MNVTVRRHRCWDTNHDENLDMFLLLAFVALPVISSWERLAFVERFEGVILLDVVNEATTRACNGSYTSD